MINLIGNCLMAVFWFFFLECTLIKCTPKQSRFLRVRATAVDRARLLLWLLVLIKLLFLHMQILQWCLFLPSWCRGAILGFFFQLFLSRLQASTLGSGSGAICEGPRSFQHSIYTHNMRCLVLSAEPWWINSCCCCCCSCCGWKL